MRTSARIDSPTEQVFRIIADLSTYGSPSLSGLRSLWSFSVEDISPGPTSAGTTFKMVGALVSLDGEVTEFEPPNLVAIEANVRMRRMAFPFSGWKDAIIGRQRIVYDLRSANGDGCQFTKIEEVIKVVPSWWSMVVFAYLLSPFTWLLWQVTRASRTRRLQRWVNAALASQPQVP